MSGYVFHCTPCGKPHAGECPPRALTEPGHWMAPGVPQLGSRWRRDMVLGSDGSKKRGTWVYTVYKIEGDKVSFNIMSMGTPVHGGTLSLAAWTPEGCLNPDTGTRHWMKPVCANHFFKASKPIDLWVLVSCTKCDTTKKVGMLSLHDMIKRGEVDVDPPVW